MSNKQITVKTSALMGAAFTFMTGWFGGGWATGQLAGKYAAQFGWTAVFLPLIGVAMICFVEWLTIEHARLSNSWNYASFMEHFYGHRIFAIIFDLIQIVSLPITFAGMVATFASTMQNFVGGAYLLWVAVFAALVILSVMWGNEVLNKISTVMGVLILILLIVVFGVIVGKGYGATVGEFVANKTYFGGHTFGSAFYGSTISLCMLTGGMALSVLPCFSMVQTRKDVTKICLFSWLFVAGFVFTISFNMLAFMPESVAESVPMLYILNTMGVSNVMYVIYTIVLLLAVVSTGNALCNGYGQRFINFKFAREIKASETTKLLVASLVIIAVSSFVAMAGITNIFYTGFTIMSYLNTPLVTLGLPIVGILKLVQMKRRNMSIERGILTDKGSWSMFTKEQ